MNSRVDMFTVRDSRVHLKEPNPSKRLCGASGSVPTRVLAALGNPSRPIRCKREVVLTHESQTPLSICSKKWCKRFTFKSTKHAVLHKFTLKFTERHHAPGLWHMFRTSANSRKGHLLPMAIMSFMLLLVTVDVPRWWVVLSRRFPMHLIPQCQLQV